MTATLVLGQHGKQSPQILQENKHNTTDGRMVFIGNASNMKYLYEQVGEDNTVKRGLLLLEFLDNLIDKDRQKRRNIKT